MLKPFCPLLFLFVSLGGCSRRPTTADLAAEELSQMYSSHVKEIHEAKAGRFQIVGETNKVALDTKTGLACKTWDWDDTHSEANFPMCVNLLANEDHEIDSVRSAEYSSEQLKDHGENPYAFGKSLKGNSH